MLVVDFSRFARILEGKGRLFFVCLVMRCLPPRRQSFHHLLRRLGLLTRRTRRRLFFLSCR